MIKIVRLEHVGIAVKGLETSNDLFARIFGKDHYKTEVVESEKVSTSFFQTGEAKIELLEGTDDSSVITKYVEKRGEGIHHLAFEVEDIKEAHSYCKKQGIRVLHQEPKRGADGKMIFFLHPKDTNGVLIEFCQSVPL
jgi:methylmalonyl-CoA/ethylmalonyl-CoA epimerase